MPYAPARRPGAPVIDLDFSDGRVLQGWQRGLHGGAPDKNNLLSIGRFARQYALSIGQLRHYQELACSSLR